MFSEWLSETVSAIAGQLSTIGIVDIIDIACVAVLLYYVYSFIRERRAGKLAIGVVFLIAFLLISHMLEMNAVQFILTNVFQVGMITLIIVFQPELRSALEKMGGESIKGFKGLSDSKNNDRIKPSIDAVCEALVDLSESKTGALVVFERTTKLGDLILTGTVINAEITPFLIKNIFFNGSPLHDGALIIRDFRLYAAGCLLPLSANPDIIKNLGTRHRAAIGMSENSDAVVVVVSEETGTISVAYEGRLKRDFDYDSLKEELTKYFENDFISVVGKVKAKFTRNK